MNLLGILAYHLLSIVNHSESLLRASWAVSKFDKQTSPIILLLGQILVCSNLYSCIVNGSSDCMLSLGGENAAKREVLLDQPCWGQG